MAQYRLKARRRKFWRPMLRPGQQRKLSAELYPPSAYQAAVGFAQGLRGAEYLRFIQRIDQAPFHHDTVVTPYFAGHSAFRAMLDSISKAEHEVLLEAYVLSDDSTGADMQAALAAAVRRGVRVKVLADAFGSLRTRSRFWQTLRASGSQVRLFRRPLYAPLSLGSCLDHRKLLIVDRTVAFTGGMNIADEYRGGRPGDTAWRDTHVQLCGGVAWELVTIFAESWAASGGSPLEVTALEPPQTPGSPTLVLDSRPGRGQNEVFSAFAATLGAARTKVWITNAYFAPSRAMTRLLIATARRGVDVRLMLAGKSDVAIVRLATQGYYQELLQAGIRIFEYQASVLHAKTLVADAEVAIIGSTNFDFRSFRFNAECNVLMRDRIVAADLEAAFCRDIEHAAEVRPEDWQGVAIPRRLLAWLARQFAFLM